MKAKLKPVESVGTARMCTLLPASVRLNAPPIACPDNVRELMHGELVMVAVPFKLKLLSCASAIVMVGGINSGWDVELYAPV